MIELLHQSPVPFLPIYLDADELFCVVDALDYTWALQWRWRPKYDKHGRKAYAVRSMDVGGDQHANRKQITVFLHKEILLRVERPPSTRHLIGDHKDGNSLNCRRHNLRWATPSENRQNVNGAFARQVAMMFKKDRPAHAPS